MDIVVLVGDDRDASLAANFLDLGALAVRSGHFDRLVLEVETLEFVADLCTDRTAGQIVECDRTHGDNWGPRDKEDTGPCVCCWGHTAWGGVFGRYGGQPLVVRAGECVGSLGDLDEACGRREVSNEVDDERDRERPLAE